MKKFIIISTVLLVLSCSQKREEFYTPTCLKDSVENRISRGELDSLLQHSPYWKLDDFKTSNTQESDAVEILKEELTSDRIDISKLLVYNISLINDSIVVFHLDHIDGLIYRYNLNKKNKELEKHPDKNGFFQVIPPCLGNPTKVAGDYIVDIYNGLLAVRYSM